MPSNSRELLTRQVRIDALARQVYRVAFQVPMPGELTVRVARAFYLPKDSRVLDDLAPLILSFATTRHELVRDIAHEACHYQLGYRSERDHPHGADFQRLHRHALARLVKAGLLRDK